MMKIPKIRYLFLTGFTAACFLVFLMTASAQAPCGALRSNEQISETPLTTVSDGCVSVDVNPGFILFENIPDSFSFPRKFSSTLAQNSFSNDNPATTSVVDVSTAPGDVLTVIDMTDSGGFTVTITSSTFTNTVDTLPLANLYIVNTYPDADDFTDATLNGTEAGGVEYAAGSNGAQDITASVFTSGDLDLAATYTTDGASFDANGDTVADTITLMDTTTAHVLRASQALSFYLRIPASQAAGTYSIRFTLDLIGGGMPP